MNCRDVSKLRTLQQQEPSRVSKMIRILWPEIRAAPSTRGDASRPTGGTASTTEKTRSTTDDEAVDEETALSRDPLATFATGQFTTGWVSISRTVYPGKTSCSAQKNRTTDLLLAAWLSLFTLVPVRHAQDGQDGDLNEHFDAEG